MPKQKHFLEHQKQKGAKLDPHTADEFLAAGVEQEEGGEKWRAGDALKSSRFFIRAIDTYNFGLQRFPQSFDLAYNKARLQYELSQQPRLLEHLPSPLLDVLHAALNSHRHALNLKPEDADTLFNTAQVLTSLGEALLEVPASPDRRVDALSYLQEAVDIFEKCLSVQQSQLQDAQSQAQAILQEPDADHQRPPTLDVSSPTATEEQEQWASVLEPITPESLLETCLAEAHVLSVLLPLLPPDPAASQTLNTHSDILLEKAHALLSSQSVSVTPDSSDELRLAQCRLNLLSALADHAYRSHRIDATNYLSALTETHASSQPSLVEHGPAQADYADALIAFNASVASVSLPESLATIAHLRWSALTIALSALTTANTTPGPELGRSVINGRRGDAELLRARLAEPEVGYDMAAKNRDQLLRNAETYYTGAAKIAEAEWDGEGSKGWWGNVEVVRSLLSGAVMDGKGLEDVLAEMSEDGLIG